MEDRPILRFVPQALGHGDCCISAMAMALDISYEQALVYMARVNKDVLVKGCTWREVRRAAKLHGATFMERRNFSLDEDSDDTGILCVTLADGTPHAVFLRNGLIFDGRTGCVWAADVFMAVHIGTATSLLVQV